MNDSESPNQGTYLQNIIENIRNKVFSPKFQGSLNSNMAATVLYDRGLEGVKDQARLMAMDIVHYVSKYNVQDPANKYMETLRRTADEVLTKHEIAFKGMIRKLKLDNNLPTEDISEDAVKTMLCGVLRELYGDNRKNWGRVVTFCAFAGYIAKHLVERDLQDMVDYCGLVLGECICSYLAEWIHRNGGWDAFNDYFANQGEAMERHIFAGLALVGGVGLLGLGLIAVR